MMNREQKILVIVTDYPDKVGNVKLQYIHTRNVAYLKFGLTVTVLNFAAKEDYFVDGIRVITLKTYKKEKKYFNELISHAPNIKQHLIFLILYGKYFLKYFFFFHGHEVLRCSKVYPKEYEYQQSIFIKTWLKNIYDIVKLKIWKIFFLKVVDKSRFIFVSNWMLEEFEKWVGIKRSCLKNRYYITYNSVGEIFEKKQYDFNCDKTYDFITIRSNLDGSKYCIDIVNNLAKVNPQYKFLVIGKGSFFQYYPKASNLEWLDKNLRHDEMIVLLNKSRCALMPTRVDSDGGSIIKKATFGIPLITSDLPVFYEIFHGFENVQYIDNKDAVDLSSILVDIKATGTKNKKYFLEKTIQEEIKIFNDILQES